MGVLQRMTTSIRNILTALCAFVPCMTLAVGPTALAASPESRRLEAHLTISEVLLDFANDQIVITGEDFDRGPRPVTVTLGSPDLIASDSIVCTPDFSAAPQTIECDFFATGMPFYGDYLLTVTTGMGASQRDAYNLTIGAVGSVGPPDEQGQQTREDLQVELGTHRELGEQAVQGEQEQPGSERFGVVFDPNQIDTIETSGDGPVDPSDASGVAAPTPDPFID